MWTPLSQFSKFYRDSEGFLRLCFLITTRRPQGEEGEFFIQLFMEPFESDRLPNIEDLLRRMFKEQNIKFSQVLVLYLCKHTTNIWYSFCSFLQVPSKLLIQVPRYGRQFKAFEKIIPSQRMSIYDLSPTG